MLRHEKPRGQVRWFVPCLVLSGALAACSSVDEGSPATGGAGPGSGGSGAGVAGHATVGGSGGVSGSGGKAQGSGGMAMSAGGSSAGQGGAGTAGGAPRGGAAGAGEAGSPPAAGASGASMNGGAGQAGSSAEGGAGAAQGGAGGRSEAGMGGLAAGSAGTAGAGVDTAIVGSWDGALLTFPCGNTHDGYNCSNTNCSNNQTTKTTEWSIGGTPGATYDVTVTVRGIVETYYYPGATRDGGSIKSNPDLFASGGQVEDSGGPSYDYNSYQLVVTPAVQGAPNIYFLNSVTMAENPHASNSPTSHLTFPINYTKTIKVSGGGKVTFSTFDSNCTFLQNCGPTEGSTCKAPRTVALDGVMPAAPTTFEQPFEQPTGAWGQWVHFDVTKVSLSQ